MKISTRFPTYTVVPLLSTFFTRAPSRQ